MKKPWEILGIGKSTYFKKKAKGLLTAAQLKRTGTAPKKRKTRLKGKVRLRVPPEFREVEANKMSNDRNIRSRAIREMLPSEVRDARRPYSAEDVAAATAVVQGARGRRGPVNFSRLESAVAEELAKVRADARIAADAKIDQTVRIMVNESKAAAVNVELVRNLADMLDHHKANSGVMPKMVLTSRDAEALRWFFTENQDRI